MDKETYQKCLKEDIRNGKAVPRCRNCGREGSVVLKEHHFFTRAGSERKELLCKNCYAKLQRTGGEPNEQKN